MFALCHGQAEGGATHVPASLQSHIEKIAVAPNNTCVVLDSGEMSCWGKNISTLDTVCQGSTIKDIYMFENSFSSPLATITAAAHCADNKLYFWDGTKQQNVLTITGVTQVSSSPTDLCFLRPEAEDIAACANFPNPALSIGVSNDVRRIYAGDEGGCIELESANQVECYGKYANTTVSYRSGVQLQDMRISGGVVCSKWTDGWTCQVAYSVTNANVAASRNLSSVWSMVGTTPQNVSVFDGLDVYQQWGSATGALCAIRTASNQVWCQGTGFNNVGDTTDGIFLLNFENTADSKAVDVCRTHACVLIEDPSSAFAWVFFCIVLFLFIVALLYGIKLARDAKKIKLQIAQLRVPQSF